MKILCTGGCGFIGSVLVPMLLEEGHDVVIVDQMWWRPERIQWLNKTMRPSNFGLGDGQIELVEDDIRDYVRAERRTDIDAVIHLAGMSNDPTANWNPELNWELNVEGTKAMVDWAWTHGIKRFVYAGTHSIYGRPSEVVSEDALPLARGPYPDSKRTAEESLWRCDEPVILRLGTLHGVSPRMRYDLMANTFAAACFKGEIHLDGGGASWRPVLDVRDAARAFIWAATAPADVVAGETFNIAHSNMRVARVAQLVADQYEQVYERLVRFTDTPARREPRSQQISTMKTFEAGFDTKYGLSSRPIRDLLQYTSIVDPDEARFWNIRWVTELLEAKAA